MVLHSTKLTAAPPLLAVYDKVVFLPAQRAVHVGGITGGHVRLWGRGHRSASIHFGQCAEVCVCVCARYLISGHKQGHRVRDKHVPLEPFLTAQTLYQSLPVESRPQIIVCPIFLIRDPFSSVCLTDISCSFSLAVLFTANWRPENAWASHGSQAGKKGRGTASS